VEPDSKAHFVGIVSGKKYSARLALSAFCAGISTSSLRGIHQLPERSAKKIDPVIHIGHLALNPMKDIRRLEVEIVVSSIERDRAMAQWERVRNESSDVRVSVVRDSVDSLRPQTCTEGFGIHGWSWVVERVECELPLLAFATRELLAAPR
jgi:hypothetical protein